MKKLKFLLVGAVFALAACGTSAETERKLAELESANAQKDSLMQEVAISSRLISDVNVELAKAKIRNNRLHVSSESPITASNDTLIARLRYVVARVQQTETALKDSLATGYYVIGTRDELKKKGILTEQGGGRVLFILWRTGKTLQPARNLDPTLFTAIDTRKVTSIPLPSSRAQYRIASLQDLEYIAEQRDNNKYSGVSSLTITSPVDFWRTSKFLVIILEGSAGPVTERTVTSEEKVLSR